MSEKNDLPGKFRWGNTPPAGAGDLRPSNRPWAFARHPFTPTRRERVALMMRLVASAAALTLALASAHPARADFVFTSLDVPGATTGIFQ
jgi:hypothetical protein